ncbi:MAG: SiaC family regulatory phosphoprotein [Bacteroidales bacterium]
MRLLEKKISQTKITPEIRLNPDGIIKITGRSMNGNIDEFSVQLEDWIDEYICNPADLTRLDVYLEYFDEINLVIYMSLLKKIESVKLKNKKYIINWYYEEGDEDILEKGENISSVLDMPFNFIMISDPLIHECDPMKWRHPQRVKF